MNQPILVALVSLAAFAAPAAQTTTAHTQDADPASGMPAASEAATVLVAQRDHETGFELSGRFVPANGLELSLWPESFNGPFRFSLVREHGLYVNTGDVVARFESRDYFERVADAERGLMSARLAQSGKEERARISEEEEQDARFDARRTVDRARQALEGWLEVEFDLKRRGIELSKQYTQHNIDDQVDELTQLEAMYSDDELVEATEEIVLSRSRRNLARSRFSQRMSLDRQAFEAKFHTPLTTEDRRLALERAEARGARLAIRQAIGKRERADALERGEVEVEKKRVALERLRADEVLLELVAARPGVLLHGGKDDYRPGGNWGTHKRGGTAGTRVPLFTIVETGKLAVALSLSQEQRSKIAARQGVRVSVAGRDSEWVGQLDVDAFPGSNGGFHARVELPVLPAGLVAGMNASVEVVSEKVLGALWLPRAAVAGSGSDAHCWIWDGASASYRRVAIEAGAEEDGEVLVSGAIEANAKVLLTGSGQ